LHSLKGSDDPYIMRGIDEMNMKACHTLSGVVAVAEAAMLVLYVVFYYSSEDFLMSLISAIYCIGICTAIFYVSGRYLKGKGDHFFAQAVVFFSMVGIFIWALGTAFHSFGMDRQILAFFVVVLCFVCFVKTRPYVSLIVYPAVFIILFIVMYRFNGAEGISVLNYIMYALVATVSAVINYTYSVNLVTGKRRNEELSVSLSDVSRHDALTGLLNRDAFEHDMDITEGKMYFIGLADVNKFKEINDKFGNNTGDWVLAELAKLLLRHFRKSDCYRYGGDKFLIIAESIGKKELEKRLYNWKKEAEEIVLPDPDKKISVCYATVFGKVRKRSDMDDLIAGVEEVFKSVKAGDPDARSEEEKLIIDFLDAMEAGDIVAYYQPKVDIRDNSLVGAEALVRWRKGDTVLPPSKFVPLLEDMGEVTTLDMYMYECVCHDMREWKDKGYRDVTISCNLSRENLRTPNLVEHMMEVADKYDIKYSSLEIEFTETVNSEEFHKLYECVVALRKNGFKVAVDDFGTGYSSLSLIKDISMDVIKLDRSLLTLNEEVSTMADDRSGALLKNIITMTRDMQMMCLAEGVETVAQRNMLKSLGCNYVQGYLYDRPLKKSEFEERLSVGYYDEMEEASDMDDVLIGDELFPLSILVVEDNEMNREITEGIMKSLGAYVVTAVDGQDGLDKFKDSEINEYDVIFMDIQMPKMDGYECTKAIRALDRADAKSVPIIAVTADAYSQTRTKAREAGMTDFVLKPLDTNRIKQILSGIMDG